MITGSVKVKLGLPYKDKLNNAIRTTVARLTMKLVAIVKRDKLRGQVLNRRTGRLSRSITANFANDGMKGIVGTNVSYGAVHELGLRVTIESHMRLQKQVFGKPIEPKMVQVKQYSVKYPEKSFLKSALKDLSPEIKPALDQAIKQAFSI